MKPSWEILCKHNREAFVNNQLECIFRAASASLGNAHKTPWSRKFWLSNSEKWINWSPTQSRSRKCYNFMEKNRKLNCCIRLRKKLDFPQQLTRWSTFFTRDFLRAKLLKKPHTSSVNTFCASSYPQSFASFAVDFCCLNESRLKAHFLEVCDRLEDKEEINFRFQQPLICACDS